MTNKAYQFKLDGSLHTVTLHHTPDLKRKQIMLNGLAITDLRQSKINPNDMTFTIEGHFCIAQFRVTEAGFTYDLLIDGRSLEARRQKRETVSAQRKETVGSRQGAAVSVPRPAASNSRPPVKSIQAKSQAMSDAAAQISSQVATRRQPSSSASSLLTSVMSEADTVVDKKRLMSPAQAEEARKKLRSNSRHEISHHSREMPAVRVDPDDEDVEYEMPASFRQREFSKEDHTPYWINGELYEADKKKAAQAEREAKAEKAKQRRLESQGGAMPAWTWLFMLACGLIPVAAVGGTLPGVLGSGGVAICASIACSRKSAALRVGLCVMVTIACWGAMIAFNGGAQFLSGLV